MDELFKIAELIMDNVYIYLIFTFILDNDSHEALGEEGRLDGREVIVMAQINRNANDSNNQHNFREECD